MSTILVIRDEEKDTEYVTPKDIEVVTLDDFEYVNGSPTDLKIVLLEDLERFADVKPKLREKAYKTMKSWLERTKDRYAYSYPEGVVHVEKAVQEAVDGWKATSPSSDAVEAWENA